MRTFVKIMIAAIALTALSLFAQAEQRTTVEKRLSSNPTVAIISFEGNAAARTKLESILALCGWFAPASNPEKADVKIQGRCRKEGNLEAYVVGLGNAFSTAHNAESTNVAVYQTVDEILSRLFKVPSLCMQKIYFVQSGNNGMKEIYACYLDGTGLERVTFNDAISTEPDFGHRNTLVYTLAKNNSLCIVLSDLANKRQAVVSRARGLNSSAALFYDGSKLALPMSLDNQVDLYIVDLKGRARTRLTNDKNVESSPTWSKDGNSICYVSDRYGVPMLFVRNLLKNTEMRLVQGAQECVSPDWSPVSNKICFSMRASGGHRVLAVVDMADASHAVNVIAEADGNWETPSWGPDGRHIVCIRSTNAGRTKDLYVVDSWTGDFYGITKNSKLTLPVWRPSF